MKTDVLVVGAGPVGLAMAIELARYGVAVRIVEKAAQRTNKSKALVLWSRTLEQMDRMGCTEAFLAAGYRVSAANIVVGSKQIGHISLSEVATPYPFALMLPQSDTEGLLEEHLNTLGVQVERSVELTGFSNSGGAVSSTLRSADGREETVTASWLIGCDGAHSTVRHQLGMGFVGDTMASNWILADVHLAGAVDPNAVSVAWHSDGILVIFPITPTRFRVIADVGNEHSDGHAAASAPPSDPTMEEVQAILNRRGPGGITVSEPLWLAGFHINERKVADYRAGRVFLTGDAAHIHSPAGGQGMNTGIQDACNLAWKLALVQQGKCSAEPLLSSYSIERSAVGEQVLKGAGRLTAIGLMKGEITQSIRNHLASLLFGLPPVVKSMADVLTEISIGYPKSPLTAHGGHPPEGPKAGERVPVSAGQPAAGAGSSARFALYAAPGDAGVAMLTTRYADLLEPAPREPFHKGGLWLVRPDGYVAFAGSEGQSEEVAAYLDPLTEPKRV